MNLCRVPLLFFVVSIALTASCRPPEAAPPTPAEAHQYLEAAEKRLEALSKKSARTAWVQNNFITVDTQQIAADAQSDVAAAVTELARAPGASKVCNCRTTTLAS